MDRATDAPRGFERGRLERRMGLSRWYLDQGCVDEALQQVERCLPLIPEDPELIRITAVIARAQRGAQPKLTEY